jgi:hypothetical protein
MKSFYALALVFFLASPLFCQPRQFDTIFPNLPLNTRNAVFSANGYIKSTEKAAGWDLISGSRSNFNPEIAAAVINKSPVFLVESLLVIPADKTLLNVYNALGRIRDLKGKQYQSHTRGRSVPLFEDATRIESARNTNPIADPQPALSVPRSETIYIKLKDTNFGTSYYRCDMSLDQYGLLYRLTNNKNLTYLFIPVIREEKFTAQLYFEAIEEGILVYSVAGADVSDFVAGRVDMPSAISKRLEVIISWVADGL